jgi:Carboxypeptidase regulatory-like domain/TonB dependent receptor
MSRLRKKKNMVVATMFLMVSTLLSPFMVPVAMAQATTGSLKGSVTDASGAVIAGADVTAKNTATGVETRTKSNDDGLYSFPRLAPGIYLLSIERQNFKRQEFQEVAVQVGQDQVIDAALQPGAVTETVTVTAQGEELLQKENVQVSSTFGSRKVSELPLNVAGNGIDTLAFLAPGVVPGLGFSNTNGAEFSVNGARARSNNFNIDGQDNNDLSVAGPGFFVDNPDVVGEFQLITNNFSAEYGRNQGAVVNIVTKSGTNQFHGTGFWFHRDRKHLDSMTNLEKRTDNRGLGFADPLLRNVAGGTFGGPVIKDRAFFFGSYQKIWQRQAGLFQSTSPAIAAEDLPRLESLPGYATNPALQTLRNFSAFAITDLGQVSERTDFPQNETVTISGQTFRVAYPQRVVSLPLNAPEFTLRGDVKLTEKHSVWYRHLWQRSDNVNAGAGSGGFTRDTPADGWHTGGQLTSQFTNTTVNEFRFAVSRLSVIFGGGCDGLVGCIPAPGDVGNTFANISLSGFRSSGGVSLQTIGGATNLPQGRIVKDYQFADNFSKIMGRHQLKMGLDLRRLTNSVPFLPNVAGAFRFSTATQLLQNRPLTVNLAAGPLEIAYKEFDQFYYFQDDWRVRDDLTLNLGIRYENTGQPVNVAHDLTVARESDPAQAFFRQNLPIEARTFPKIPTDKNNWAPRVGFAWRPNFGGGLGKRLFGEQNTTVISGGFSIAYDPAFHNILLNITSAAPTVFLFTVANPATGAVPFPLPASPISDNVQQFARANNLLAFNTFDPRLLNQTLVSPNFHSPYAEQWSLRVQREIARNNVLEVRYVGTHGVGLFQTVNGNPRVDRLINGFTLGGFTFPGFPNLVPSGVTPVTCVNDPATADNEAACQGRVLPGHGLIRTRQNSAQSIYHGLQARYDGRMFNQLTIGMSYAFQKAIDNASEIFASNESPVSQNPYDTGRGERGLSGFDRRHVYSLNYLWDIPFFKNQEGFVGRTLGGWQVNGFYLLGSGQHYTPTQFFLFNGLPGVSYEDTTFAAGFVGLDTLRPFVGSPNAPRDQVGISQIDANLIFGAPVADPNGFYLFNALNTTGDVVPVTKNDVAVIFNGPGAAKIFGTPFGDVARGSETGPKINSLNLGIFKNIKIRENLRLQFRTEMFNALNHPNGFDGDATPDIIIEDAGSTYARRDEISGGRRIIQFGLRIIF